MQVNSLSPNKIKRESLINRVSSMIANSGTIYEVGRCKPIEQLGIKYNGEEDLNQLNFVLKQILQYPSTEAAIRHQSSNCLGSHDLIDGNCDKFSLQEISQMGGFKFCQCCGFLLQENEIKICTKLEDIPNLGISTYLYFRVLLTVIYLLAIMLLVYSVFAIGSNILASQKIALDISLATKQLNATTDNLALFTIEMWLGVAFLIIWLPTLIYLKGVEKRKILGLKPNSNIYQREQESISAADFSVIMENVPKFIDKEKMQAYFDEYQIKINRKLGLSKTNTKLQFKIAKFNVGRPFYLNQQEFQNKELRQLNQQHERYVKQFCQWIIERTKNDEFSEKKSIRQVEYSSFKKLKQKRFAEYELLTKKVLAQFQESSEKQLKNTVFLTFTTNTARNMILQLNGYDWTSEIRDKIFCCSQNRLKIQNDSGILTNIKILPAPEPEDIIWINLGHSFGERTKRRFVTFIITLLLLLLSFTIVYGLTYIKQGFLEKNNLVMSYSISLITSIFNIIIQVVIRVLTFYERSSSTTGHQTSLALKSVLALLINSILIPILAGLFFKRDLYTQSGLISQIFTLSITNAFLTPILKIFDSYYYFMKIFKWWKNKPNQKLRLNQHQLNQCFEKMQFQAGFEYVYVINVYLFTCFFVTLQPIIPLFAILGLTAMYWAQKYSLFHRCKRPVPGTTRINTIMFQFIYLGPLVYTIGSLIWEAYFPESEMVITRIPLIVSFALSGLILFLPYEKFFGYLYGEAKNPLEINYQDNIIFLPSQYDRLNPATSEGAIRQYVKYVKQYTKQLNQKNTMQKRKFQQIFLKQIARGHQQNSRFIPRFSGESADNSNVDLLQQIFKSKGNMLSLIHIGTAILPQSDTLKPNIHEMILKSNQPQLNQDIRGINQALLQKYIHEDKQNSNIYDIMRGIIPQLFESPSAYSNIFQLSNSNEQKKMPDNLSFLRNFK